MIASPADDRVDGLILMELEVFITASRFTQVAHNEADRINARIELINGAKLAQLLVAYGVGVQTEETVVLYGLDEDFFESL